MNDKTNQVNEETKVTPDEPVISNEELKMPEEQFGAPASPPESSSRLGMVLGILIVILVLILAGLYLWGTTFKTTPPPVVTPLDRPTAEENNEPESVEAEAEVETMQALSTSDEIAAIEADLNSTDLDELDAELNAIEAELEASAQQ